MPIQKAKFSIGDIVKHKHFEFRGVIYDVDFKFNNSEEYVSEQNLLIDDSNEPIKHPLIEEIFSGKKGSGYFKPSN